MSLIQGIEQFTNELESVGVQYAIIGGLAVFAYGGERTTFDVDFLIHGDDREKIKQIAQGLSLKIINENEEVIQFSGQIQIDIIFANREKARAMLSNAKKIDCLPYPVVSAEDLVGLKIQAFSGDRSREFIDKGDILTIFKNVSELDFNKIKEYADLFNVWNEIEEIKKRS